LWSTVRSLACEVATKVSVSVTVGENRSTDAALRDGIDLHKTSSCVRATLLYCRWQSVALCCCCSCGDSQCGPLAELLIGCAGPV